MINVDPVEIEKFSQLAHRWWDPGAEFRPLHDINPLRLNYIEGIAGLQGKRVLDVGCGGGILAESMAARGAEVTGIDLAEKPLKVAQLHLLESGRAVDYRLVAPEALALEMPAHFDIVTCMELLEHVPQPARTVEACATLVRPHGHVFFSTISRNLKSYLFAILGAEYILSLLPRGTHDYAKFIKPSELAGMCRNAGLEVSRINGMTYNPLTRQYALGPDAEVNYLLHAIRQ
jgi:2-polyprenyl-6-hydroxyphenyl methylase / 3-demethylubiquinone-9 3-methyltransferase